MLYQLSYFRLFLLLSDTKRLTGNSVLRLESCVLRLSFSGESRIRTYEGVRQQIYSLPQLAALVFPQKSDNDLVLQ
jgi:hypothetical protein